MTTPDRDNPLARFLGGATTPDDPASVLGLDRTGLSPDAIANAIHARLAQIDAHPLAGTPDADEARLEVHLAAARLTDRTSPAAPPPTSTNLAPAIQRFRRDARMAIAATGGWGPKTLHRLAAVAVMHGVPIGSIRPALAGLDTPARTRPKIQPSARKAPTQPLGPMQRAPVSAQPKAQTNAPTVDYDPDEIDPIWRRARLLGIAVLIILATVSVLVTTLFVGRWAFTGSQRTQTVESEPRVQPDSIPGDAPRLAGDQPAYIPPIREQLDDHKLVLREFETAAILARDDPQAGVERFGRGINAWMRRWPIDSPEQRSRVIDAASGAFARLAAGDTTRPLLLDALAQPTTAVLTRQQLGVDGPWSVMGGVGLIASLMLEENTDTKLRSQLASRLVVFSPPVGGWASFDDAAAGVGGWLASGRIGDDPEAWRRWADALQAVTTDRPAMRTVSLRAGLEELLTRQMPPADAERACVAVLVKRLNWRGGDGSRRWVVRLFDDPRISTPRLAALTGELATISSAAGIDATMMLDPTSDQHARGELGEQYASTWRITQLAPHSLFAQDWINAYNLLEAAAGSANGEPVHALALAVEYARLNTAGVLATRGQLEHASELISQITPVIRTATQSTPTDDALGPISGDGRWMARYANAGAADDKSALLGQIAARSGPIGHADAGELVHEAFRGSPRAVRDAARAAFDTHATEPRVLLALLERAGDILPNDRSAETLVAAIGVVVHPEPKDDFEARVRRAILARLIGVIQSHPSAARIDDLGAELAGLYATRAGFDQHTPLNTTARSLAADVLASINPAQAPAGLSPAAISTRRDARLGFADDPIRIAAVELRALTEARGCHLASVDPGAARAAAAVVRELDRRWADAGHVFDQFAACERALARLQLLDHKGGGA